MKRLHKKYITIILGICIFWLAGIPFLFSRLVPVICENITYNYEYNVSVEKPRLYMNIIPTAVIKADRISISTKNSDDMADIKDFKMKLRLLPLLSGRVHFDIIQASDISINSVIEKNKHLEKEFVTKLLKTKVYCDSLKIEKLVAKIKESDIKEPAVYTANNIFYVKNGRYLRLNAESTIDFNGKQSVINASLYLPKNNNIKDSDLAIELSNFDVAPMGDFLKDYLPRDTVSVSGIIDLKANKEHLNVNIRTELIKEKTRQNQLFSLRS